MCGNVPGVFGDNPKSVMTTTGSLRVNSQEISLRGSRAQIFFFEHKFSWDVLDGWKG